MQCKCKVFMCHFSANMDYWVCSGIGVGAAPVELSQDKSADFLFLAWTMQMIFEFLRHDNFLSKQWILGPIFQRF